MSLSADDLKYLTEKFDNVKEAVVDAVKEHEATYHQPGRPLKTAATLVGIGAAAITILGGLLAAFLWLVQYAPH